MGVLGPGGLERVGAIIVAAGTSNRMGGQDKIFGLLLSRPLLAWTVDVFERCPLIDDVAIAVHPARLDEARTLALQAGWKKVSAICPGGERRQDSVREALACLPAVEWVAVHDGARPCLSQELLARGLDAARETGAAVPGLPVTDTVKRIDGHGIATETLERSSLRAVQTPQIFRYAILRSAYDGPAIPDVTDDASLVELRGHKVMVFPGSIENLKVTAPGDLVIAAEVLARRGKPPASGG